MKYTREYLEENSLRIECNSSREAQEIVSIYGGKNDYDAHQRFFDTRGVPEFYDWLSCIEKSIPASEVIADYEASKQNRKILGYKAPFDMFGSVIKKDDVLEPSITSHYWHINRFPETIYLPAEIVEQWDPVYEEDKPTHIIGSFSELVNYFKDDQFIVIKKGEYIAVTNSVTQDKPKRQHYFYLNYGNGYGFTDSFQQELAELGIKF